MPSSFAVGRRSSCDALNPITESKSNKAFRVLRPVAEPEATHNSTALSLGLSKTGTKDKQVSLLGCLREGGDPLGCRAHQVPV